MEGQSGLGIKTNCSDMITPVESNMQDQKGNGPWMENNPPAVAIEKEGVSGSDKGSMEPVSSCLNAETEPHMSKGSKAHKMEHSTGKADLQPSVLSPSAVKMFRGKQGTFFQASNLSMIKPMQEQYLAKIQGSHTLGLNKEGSKSFAIPAPAGTTGVVGASGERRNTQFDPAALLLALNPEPRVSLKPKEPQNGHPPTSVKPKTSSSLELEEFLKILPGGEQKLRDFCMGQIAKSVTPIPTFSTDVPSLYTHSQGPTETVRRKLRSTTVAAERAAQTRGNVNKLLDVPSQPTQFNRPKPSEPPRKVSGHQYGRVSTSVEVPLATGGARDGKGQDRVDNKDIKWTLRSTTRRKCQKHDFAEHFEHNQEVIRRLRSLFLSPETERHPDSESTSASLQDSLAAKLFEMNPKPLLEWFPVEPKKTKDYTNDISQLPSMLLLESEISQNEEQGQGLFHTLQAETSELDTNTHIKMLHRIHEMLYTSSDLSSLRTVEKFMVELLQSRGELGQLSSHGVLMTYIALAAIRRHMFLLHALYQHPEMAAIREILLNGEEGYITKVLSISDGNANGLINDELANAAIKEIIERIDNNAEMHYPVSIRKCSALGELPNLPPFGSKVKHPIVQPLLNMKSNKKLVKALDELSSIYDQGAEPHFPRYVCGGIDRTAAMEVETLSIPFDKTERRNIHVQFERYQTKFDLWPELTYLPYKIDCGLRVQVSSSKVHTGYCWLLGTVTAITSGILVVSLDPFVLPPGVKPVVEHHNKGITNDRIFQLRNFLPPNVPTTRIEKSQWRLLPLPIDKNRHIYIGACLSVMDRHVGGYVDMVITNIGYGRGDTEEGIGVVKSPTNESVYECIPESYANTSTPSPAAVEAYNNVRENPVISNIGIRYKQNEGRPTCHCQGHTLRVFEGLCIDAEVRTVVLSALNERRDVIVKIDDLEGYKLNYDLQAHFDIQAEDSGKALVTQSNASSVTNFQHCVWVIPRHLRPGDIKPDVGTANRIGSQWFFEPEKCTIMIPFNRNSDLLQDSVRVVSFLHPELNYNALCTGIWNLRVNRPCSDASEVQTGRTGGAFQGNNEMTSYTRSQKAATRELKMSDIVSDACNGLARCSMSLIRRLMGCHSVISLWIAMDGFDPDEPSCFMNLAIMIPLKPNCPKCNGSVYSSEEITRTIMIDSEDELVYPTEEDGTQSASTMETSREVPVFGELEKTEVVMRRLTNLASSRWRLTREYIASYTLEDEFYPTGSRSSQQATPAQNGRCDPNKSTFISKFVKLMGDVKKSNDVTVDEGIYRKAFQWADRYFNTQGVENILMRGWGSFLTNKGTYRRKEHLKKKTDEAATSELFYGGKGSYDTTSNNKKGPGTDAEKCEKTESARAESDKTSLVVLRSLRKTGAAAGKRKNSNQDEEHDGPSRRRRKGEEGSEERATGKTTPLGSEDGSKTKKKNKDGEKKPLRTTKVHPGKPIQTDCNAFTDKEIRFRYVSILNWDEDLEPLELAMEPTTGL